MHRNIPARRCAGARSPFVAILVAAPLVVSACGAGSSAEPSVTTTASVPDSAASATEPTQTEPTTPATEPASTASTTVTEPTTPPVTEPDVDLAERLQPIIDASLVPGAIDWNCCGADIPATSVRLGVRAPGFGDVVLASGTRLDGTRALATDPFHGDSLGHGLVRQATLALISDGTIDPTATVEQWLPDQPAADRITVQMLLDNTHGWTTSASDFITPNLLDDPARAWTLAETLALAMSQPPAAEPATFDPSGGGNTIGMIALAYVLEQVTGSSLTAIVDDRVTTPLGLDGSFFGIGSDDPADLQFGLFVLPGGTEASDPRDLSTVAFRTIDPPSNALITTIDDLLDLVAAWGDGSYSGGVAPTSVNFPDAAALSHDGQIDAYQGDGVPFNGYCPCESADEGVTPSVIGRQPNGVGNVVLAYTYPDDISVVLQYNSQEYTSKEDIRKIADEVHDTVASAISK